MPTINEEYWQQMIADDCDEVHRHNTNWHEWLWLDRISNCGWKYTLEWSGAERLQNLIAIAESVSTDHSACVKVCVTELFWARFESPPEKCCKILTGGETASESNLGNAHGRSLSQQFCRKVKPAMIQVVHGRHISQLMNVVHKLCALQPAVRGHHFNCPREGQIVPMSDQVI